MREFGTRLTCDLDVSQEELDRFNRAVKGVAQHEEVGSQSDKGIVPDPKGQLGSIEQYQKSLEANYNLKMKHLRSFRL
jgi:hypothetical protein